MIWIKAKLTCTNAVATKTPVPKCLQAKNNFGGTFKPLIFLAATGKPAPIVTVLGYF